MVLMIVELGFWVLGVKFLLGLYLIYMLLPSDRVCAACDSETVAVLEPRGVRVLLRACGLHLRWCYGCGRSALARKMEVEPGLRQRPTPPVVEGVGG